MKVEFSHHIDLQNLANYCVKEGWLELEPGWTREGLVYRTKSGSAKMTLTPNQGVYEGQRSLLFSHGVFSWITKEWLEGKLDFYYWESSTGQHPMEYYGRCYMRGLRDEVARKFLIISPNNEEYQELLGVGNFRYFGHGCRREDNKKNKKGDRSSVQRTSLLPGKKGGISEIKRGV
ncbi:MAG: hypothetical protein IPL87_02195 [Candidatus Moraniibacteriota bacterium]|nr:MAG: hypothetical protein IPL87_02195 [Candidatus Moranbacteria bacterium]